ncbi:MAG: amidohydrolase family protein [Bacteroidota bacterium]|jgi:dihydroorotase-like cyclic amidohydrolase
MNKLLLCTALLVSQLLAAQTIVIRNTNILPMTHDTVLIGQTVIIENGIIKSISKTPEIPLNAEIINANGMYLTPGLMDMHAHLENDFSRYDYYRYSMACGVTLMRSMRTEEKDIAERDKIEKGEITGPHLWLTAPPISGDSTWDQIMINVAVNDAKKKGFTCLKYLGGLDSLQFEKLAATAKSAGLSIVGHAPPGKLTQAISTGMRSIEHAPVFFNLAAADTATQRYVISKMAAANVAFCPNLHHYNLLYNMYTKYERENLPGLSIVPKNKLAAWDKSLNKTWKYFDSLGFTADKQKQRMGSFSRLIPMMSRNGVLLLCSPDVGEYTVPGYAMVEELMQFMRFGLTPYEALKTATVNPAKVLGETKRGTVQVGNFADLVLLAENPLNNMRAYQYAKYTIVHGKVYSTRKLRKGKYVP